MTRYRRFFKNFCQSTYNRSLKPNFENIVAGQSSFVAVQCKDPEFPFFWHYHPEYELTLILDSHGQRLVGDGVADYGPGDLVLIGPNVPHSWRSGPVRSSQNETHRAVVLQFREDFMGPHFFELNEMKSVARLLLNSSDGLAFGHTETAARVARRLTMIPSVSPAKRLVLLLTALVELAGESHSKVLSSQRVRPIGRPAD